MSLCDIIYVWACLAWSKGTTWSCNTAVMIIGEAGNTHSTSQSHIYSTEAYVHISSPTHAHTHAPPSPHASSAAPHTPHMSTQAGGCRSCLAADVHHLGPQASEVFCAWTLRGSSRSSTIELLISLNIIWALRHRRFFAPVLSLDEFTRATRARWFSEPLGPDEMQQFHCSELINF